MAADIFTAVEEGLWTALTGNATWASYIKAANRVDFTADEPNRIRDEAVYSDLPEFRLYPSGGVANETRSSSHVSWTQNYACQVFTGDQRTSRWLNPIKFATFAVIESAPVTLSGVSATNLIDVQFVDFADEMEINPASGRPAGWQTFGTIKVRLKFPRGDLLSVLALVTAPVGA